MTKNALILSASIKPCRHCVIRLLVFCVVPFSNQIDHHTLVDGTKNHKNYISVSKSQTQVRKQTKKTKKHNSIVLKMQNTLNIFGDRSCSKYYRRHSGGTTGKTLRTTVAVYFGSSLSVTPSSTTRLQTIPSKTYG